MLYVNTWLFLSALGVAIFGPTLGFIVGASLGRGQGESDD